MWAVGPLTFSSSLPLSQRRQGWCTGLPATHTIVYWEVGSTSAYTRLPGTVDVGTWNKGCLSTGLSFAGVFTSTKESCVKLKWRKAVWAGVISVCACQRKRVAAVTHLIASVDWPLFLAFFTAPFLKCHFRIRKWKDPLTVNGREKPNWKKKVHSLGKYFFTNQRICYCLSFLFGLMNIETRKVNVEKGIGMWFTNGCS